MRIGLFTDAYFPEISGVANSVYELKNGLEDAGHQVYVFTVANSSVNQADDSERNVYRVTSMPFATLKERRIGLPNTIKYFKIIEELNLDLIHTHTEFSLGSLGKRAAYKFNIPFIHTYHTLYENYIHYIKIPQNSFTFSLVGKFVKKFTDTCDLIIVPTAKVIKSMHKYKVNKSLKIIPTGLDLEKFQNVDLKHVGEIREKYKLNPDNVVLISVGRISQEKNLEEILKLFKELAKFNSNVKLMLVGDGPAKAELEDLSSEWGLIDRLVFTGYVDWDRIQDYYAAGDIFVSASDSETQGLTYSEALAVGIPLLVKDDPCLKDVLCHKQNGYAFTSQSDFFQGFNYINNKLLADPNWGKGSKIYTREDFVADIIKTYEEVLISRAGIQYHQTNQGISSM